jgi:uroporphyrinogen-III synthase
VTRDRAELYFCPQANIYSQHALERSTQRAVLSLRVAAIGQTTAKASSAGQRKVFYSGEMNTRGSD